MTAGNGAGPRPTYSFTDLEEDELSGAGRIVPSGPGAQGEVDLTATYLGMHLRSPVVASSSPLTGQIASLQALDAAGVGAVVLPSLFEEQLEHESQEVDRFLGLSSDVNPEATYGYAPVFEDYNRGSVQYLNLIREAKAELDVPVIASLNGSTTGGWTEYAKMLTNAGADAIELNIYQVAADPDRGGRDVEAETLDVVRDVVGACDVPVAVKLSPYWSALGAFAQRLVGEGAAGLVLFNRFYQPDIDLETLAVGPRLVLSNSEELRLPLRWMAMLHGRIDASLAATTGIHEPTDVVKVLLAGANVAMTTSAVLRHGPGHAATLVDGLRAWMEARDYASVEQMTGSVSQRSVTDPAAFERANYLQTLTKYSSEYVT
ncbi:MAG: dihydroorotate dehydrogenase-like protein [Nitriliruptor sp.]|nr:MAG: dihydroorotate dehydrogenase-like protein [Nitriliruptor sp.]